MAVSKRLRYEILRRDEFKCRYCMTATPGIQLVVDHVMPKALGGTDDPSNLVTACEPCNSGKTSSAPDASLIASANDDQLRWALAMKRAAQAAAEKRSEMDDYQAAFRMQWELWTVGGKPLDLPGDWTTTMDRFHNAGLPAFVWDEIVTTAMANKYVDNPFKYICGIAWNKVTELHSAARSLLATEGSHTPNNRVGNDDKDELYRVFGHLFALWAWAWDRSSKHEARTDKACEEFTANLVALLLAGASATHDLYEVVFTAGSHGVTSV